MRVLITGASGFAGGYLAEACAAAGEEVFGVSRSGAMPSVPDGQAISLDLCDGDAVHKVVASSRPDVVYHLAALSSVGRSWDAPAATMRENGVSAANVLEAVRAHAPQARLLWASSCEVYGTAGELPIRENAPLHPENPYAISKVAGDLLAELYSDAHGLDVIRTRPFNHAGPRQRSIFLASSLARQAAEARRAGVSSTQIVTGNPATRRDFTDVRDVVRAYRLLVEQAPRGVYNVSSGTSVSAGEQVSIVSELLAPIEVEHIVDPARVRAHEVMDLRGSHEHLSAVTGWQPEIPFRQTMQDAVEWWERELAAEPRVAEA